MLSSQLQQTGDSMRLATVHVRNYRSIRDSGVFAVEDRKTILVGPNEAGKTALLQAIQQLNPPGDVKKFDALRDYPRSSYNDITTKKIDPAKVPVVTGVFTLSDEDKEVLPLALRSYPYSVTRYLDNHATHFLVGAPVLPQFGQIRKSLLRLAAHLDSRNPAPAEGAAPSTIHTDKLLSLIDKWQDTDILTSSKGVELGKWVKGVTGHVDEKNAEEQERLDAITLYLSEDDLRTASINSLFKRIPIFVLFSNYFRVRPLIHLGHLASRLKANNLDDDQYDYGNLCLLKLLGFTAGELSALGNAPDPAANDPEALRAYRDQLDKRSYQLNAASVTLTGEIRRIWNPSTDRPEADRLRVVADGQYLKVVVEDDLGVEVELDQRSEGFQWLVSFFIVFFAEAAGEHANAILLLDEPGLSLHALKQREFRQTVSRLAEANQTIYTTHSPFLVGPDELDLVRVVELPDRKLGTKVHTTVTSSDAAALLPLQEALGYDLAQSIFTNKRNLVLEGLTDYWYVEAVSALLGAGGVAQLNDKISLISANTAGKVVYFATFLHANNLKVAALLDSDAAGDQAASQDALVHILGNKSILRTKDFATGISHAEIEDLLRETLPKIAFVEFGVEVSNDVSTQPARALCEIMKSRVPSFSKYRLAKAFVKWSRDHESGDLSEGERQTWAKLLGAVNAVLK